MIDNQQDLQVNMNITNPNASDVETPNCMIDLSMSPAASSPATGAESSTMVAAFEEHVTKHERVHGNADDMDQSVPSEPASNENGPAIRSVTGLSIFQQ